MNLARFCIFAVVSISLSGCFSMGKKVDTEKMTQFEKGKTTKQQVISAMGAEPSSTTVNADGTTLINYFYSAGNQDPKAYIPIVGLFFMKVNTQTQNCTFTFDKKSIYLNGSCTNGAT